MTLYGYPEMGCFGLGHSLLAWGRCVVWCEQTGVQMLAPRWFKLRLGPYLRGERDKREYFKLFDNTGMLRGLRRDLVWLRAQKIIGQDGFFEQDVYSREFLETHMLGRGATILLFENARADNERKHFHEVKGHSELLRRRFERMARQKYRPARNPVEEIAIHVRMGDFTAPKSEADLTKNSTRLPLEWYIHVLEKLREFAGRDVSAIVYSDGNDDELRPLLALSGIRRAPRQESVTDLLSIAQAPILIGSGSGFSLWGSFLGQVPSVFFPGRKIVPFLDDPRLEVESGFGDPLPESFLNHPRLGFLRAPRV